MKRRLDLLAGLFMGLILAAPVLLHAAGASAEADNGALRSAPTEILVSPPPQAGEAGGGLLEDQAGTRDRAGSQAGPETEPDAESR